MTKNTKVLFILKRKTIYSEEQYTHVGLSTGLINSASFVNDMLNDVGIESNLVVVDDNNDIDREVTKHHPTYVIIEALWVVPLKFDILCKLHPEVKWIVRFHSDIPFLAQEGNAMDWIARYIKNSNVHVAFNSLRILKSVREYIEIVTGWSKHLIHERIIYLPNYYPEEFRHKHFSKEKDEINISCFGAIRPLKNQLNQAVAAIIFANKINKKLNFHINGNRIEQKGDAIFKNLVEMFIYLNAELIIHPWAPREDFLETCSEMDIAMQCSFSETFNIVAADTLSQGVPLVASNEVPWSSSTFNAHPTDTDDIVHALSRTYQFPQINVDINKISLKSYILESKEIWNAYLR